MPLHKLIADNIEALQAGAAIIDGLAVEQFTMAFEPIVLASCGKHFRHIADHYTSFFHGLSSGYVDYNNRKRETVLESDPTTAQAHIHTLIEQLTDLKSGLLGCYSADMPLKIGLDTSVEERQLIPTESSVARELVFLHSHTTHHFSIIATVLTLLNCPVERDFGIAPSTRNHELNVSAANQSASP